MNYYICEIILTWLTLIILAVLVQENNRIPQKEKKSYFLTYGVIALAALSEWLGLQFNGDPSVPLWTVKLIKCADYILTPMAGGALVAQIHHKSIFKKLIAIILAVNTVWQPIGIFTGLMITFDDQHYYHDGPLYYAYIALYFLIILLVVLEFAFFGKSFRKQNKVSLCSTFVLIIAGILIQDFSDDRYRIAYLALAIAMALMFIHNTEFSQLVTDDFLKEQQYQIMMSQIQPHFLYNTLGSIQALCELDPKAAAKATSQFSQYLRGNMDSIKQTAAVPFEKELEHTKLYLELEQLRFKSMMNVTYDIACTDFSVPVLTLQPIAENAVRHGIRGIKKSVGTVTISTKELSDRYEIIVADNGPGFDPQALPPNDGRTHIGIKNVRDRLRHVCNGKLIIASAVGKGTSVTLAIPKEKGASYADIRHRR